MPVQQARNDVLTVSEFNRAIKELLEGSFMPLWLTGEVGNLTIHRSGHVYMTLKDARSQVSAVYFNGAGAARRLQLREGMAVDLYGSVGVYEARGQYQVTVQQIRLQGLGMLQQKFEELKQMLMAEGLFEQERKRPIPALPRCIGVVTSPDGAAIRDFLQIIRRRFAGMHVRICPASVQGAGAAPEIVRAIEFLNRRRACDVIVVTRGGGSLEDLWAFNEESVARAIVKSAIPVISAVGHEVDFTIADFVADLRVPTPSAAAELVVGQQSEYLERLANLDRRLLSGLQLQLGGLRNRLDRCARHYVFREPMHMVRNFQQRLDDQSARMGRHLTMQVSRQQERLQRCARHYVFREPLHLIRGYQQRLAEQDTRLARQLTVQVSRQQERLQRLDTQLRLLNPRQVLTRGYAILLDHASGKPVTQARQVAPGDQLRAILAEGELKLHVNDNEIPEQSSI